jgi:hypothetical protein
VRCELVDGKADGRDDRLRRVRPVVVVVAVAAVRVSVLMATNLRPEWIADKIQFHGG